MMINYDFSGANGVLSSVKWRFQKWLIIILTGKLWENDDIK